MIMVGEQRRSADLLVFDNVELIAKVYRDRGDGCYEDSGEEINLKETPVIMGFAPVGKKYAFDDDANVLNRIGDPSSSSSN